MRSFSSASFVLTTLGVAASSGQAQQQAILLETGARVRLLSPALQPDRQIVRIESATSDKVVFRSERNSESRTLALSDITAVEVAAGHRRHTGTGAILGFLSGAAVGGILGYATYEHCPKSTLTGDTCLFPGTAGSSAAVLGLVGGAAGLVIGTTVGWLSKSEKWERVTLRSRPAIGPSRGGVGLSLSVRF